MRLENSRYYKVGAVSFAVSELASLSNVLLAMFPDPKPTNFEVSFKNINKQTMIAESVGEITSDNYLIPMRLVNPSISASNSANGMRYSVLIGPKQNVGNDGKMETRYGLFLDTEDSGWHARVDTLLARLKGHSAWYSGLTQWLLGALLFAIAIASLAVSMSPDRHSAYLRAIAGASAAAAFASLFYVLMLPTVTIIIRPDPKAKLLPGTLALITAISALLSAIGAIRSFFGKPDVTLP